MYQLSSLTLELTRSCNARCIHCIVDAGHHKQDELTNSEILNLLEEIRDLGCKNVTFTGGEPFLRKEWPLFLQKSSSLGMSTVFMTNGLLLNDAIIDTLSRFDGVALGISLDGPDAQTHDYIRGVEGTFDNFLKIIPKLQEAGVYTAIPTTVMKSNFDKLDAIRDLLIDLNVPAWQIQIVKPNPRNNEEVLTEQQYYALAEKIVDYRKNYLDKIEITEADCIGHNSVLSKHLYWNKWRGCECGLYIAAIESDGNVKGCPNMNNSEGNIKARSFKAIWEDHNSFKYNRRPNIDSLKGYCTECAHKYVCRGACPIIPVTESGSKYCLYKIETAGCG